MKFWTDNFWAGSFWKQDFWLGLNQQNTGTEIINTNATTNVPVNYSICSRSGFKVPAGTLVRDGYGNWVRPEDYEPRHPQEFVRSRAENTKGSVSPEGGDTFLSDNEVKPEDL